MVAPGVPDSRPATRRDDPHAPHLGLSGPAVVVPVQGSIPPIQPPLRIDRDYSGPGSAQARGPAPDPAKAQATHHHGTNQPARRARHDTTPGRQGEAKRGGAQPQVTGPAPDAPASDPRRPTQG